MSVRDGHNKSVTFDATDDIEQKIDKLTTMMGKLVTEDEGQGKTFNHEYINLTEVADRIEVAIQIDLGPIMHIGDTQYITRTLELE